MLSTVTQASMPQLGSQMCIPNPSNYIKFASHRICCFTEPGGAIYMSTSTAHALMIACATFRILPRSATLTANIIQLLYPFEKLLPFFSQTLNLSDRYASHCIWRYSIALTALIDYCLCSAV